MSSAATATGSGSSVSPRPAGRPTSWQPRRPRSTCPGSWCRIRPTEPAVAAALRAAGSGAALQAGPDAVAELAARPADVVLNGIAGAVGLPPTLAALQAGATLALANKESLIIGGPLVTAAAAPGQIVPVDSEHSALAQCLRGGSRRRGRAG